MLLQRLAEHADRLAETGPAMYALTRIKYVVRVDQNGDRGSIITLTGDENARNDRGKEMLAPTVVRTVATKPKLLADNAEYALGWAREGQNEKKVAARHQSFVELTRTCVESTNNAVVGTVLRFLEGSGLANLERPADFDPTANVTFEVEGWLPITDPAIQAFWARYMGVDGDQDDAAPSTQQGQCLVCGKLTIPVERLQFKIKGIPGGQPSGTSLISANANAFESYGLEASRVSPICANCAERFSKGLNDLLTSSQTRLRSGNLVYAIWTREASPFSYVTLFTDPQPEQVRALFESPRTAQQGSTKLETNQFYAIALAASGGRVAVRDWIDTTVGEAQRHLIRYFKLQRLIRHDGSEPQPFKISSLIGATVRAGSRDEAAPVVPRLLFRCAIAGGPLPVWLLAAVLRRLRTDQQVTQPRVALVKMVLASSLEEDRWEDLVELQPSHTGPAYLCGRLLAVLDAVQYAALGSTNATIIDRFFGTASTAPASVFPRLVRGAEPHLAKLRRDRPGTYTALDRRLQEVMSGLERFPRTLSTLEQGQFVLGFYHQRAADAKARLEHRLHQAGEGEQDGEAADHLAAS